MSSSEETSRPPILDYDPARTALIEPAALLPRHEAMPSRCVVCFFQDVIDELLADGRLTELLSDRSEMGSHPVYVMERAGQRVAVFHPGVGAPLAAGLLEHAIARGADRFVVCGGAGALRPELHVATLVVPTSALREEGTSYHYLPPGAWAVPHPEALAAIRAALEARGLPYRTGITWTTDAFYRETPVKVARRREQGCLTVEMEASALFAVAAFRGVRLGQILYAGDDLSGEAWDARGWNDRQDVRRALFDVAVEACLNM
jgi:uridine phosphorylase